MKKLLTQLECETGDTSHISTFLLINTTQLSIGIYQAVSIHQSSKRNTSPCILRQSILNILKDGIARMPIWSWHNPSIQCQRNPLDGRIVAISSNFGNDPRHAFKFVKLTNKLVQDGSRKIESVKASAMLHSTTNQYCKQVLSLVSSVVMQ